MKRRIVAPTHCPNEDDCPGVSLVPDTSEREGEDFVGIRIKFRYRQDRLVCPRCGYVFERSDGNRRAAARHALDSFWVGTLPGTVADVGELRKMLSEHAETPGLRQALTAWIADAQEGEPAGG